MAASRQKGLSNDAIISCLYESDSEGWSDNDDEDDEDEEKGEKSKRYRL